jgi:hypothetical protein
MKMLIADIADRYTILLLKKEHEVEVDEDLEQYEEELKGVDTSSLYSVNRSMWKLEDMITYEPDAEVIGLHYLTLRRLTKKRVEERNLIAAKHGEPLERKTY